MSARIEIVTLGRLSVQRDGVTLDNFISTKAILLFVYLAMNPGDHARKKLAAMLWSETTDEQALKNLRTVLSSVRGQVGDALLISRDDLTINPEFLVNVDALRLESGFKRLSSSPTTMDTYTALCELEALYQGAFLENIVVREAEPINEWIAERQRSLHELYVTLLHQLVESAHRQGHDDDGLIYARRLVMLEPLWDAAQRQLMRLLAQLDRANEALQHYEQFADLLADELQATPEAETTALYEQIRSRGLRASRAPTRLSVAVPTMPFIEPADDVEIAQRMLNTPPCRLLTIIGIGGIGKTALASQLAFHRQHQYAEGACFVSLSTARSALELCQLVAQALELSASGDATALERAIVDHLKSCELLLVLDNYEQLLPESSLIQRILEEARAVQVIVTSQMPLSLYQEWLLPLRGLRLPENAADNPQESEAVRLFELTAQRLNPRFRLADSLPDVIEICRLVDSLPLGIVIAAGWVQYVSPADILSMMQRDLFRLEAVHQDFPVRHQSFHQLLNAMLVHLSADEQQALMCLSIFEGSFDYQAALSVADITLDDLKTLADKCLIQRTEGFRYTLHSVLRQAFKPRLERSALLHQVVERYIAHFQAWCDDFYARGLPLHELMVAIDVEQHNLWNPNLWKTVGVDAVQCQRFLLHIAPTLSEYWINRGYHRQGILEILRAGGSNRDIAPQTRVRGLMTLARILERTSQYDEAWTVCEQVLDLEQGLDLPEFRARALRVLSEICSRQTRYAEATTYLQAIIAMESQVSPAQNLQMERLFSLAYEDLGEVLLSQGDYATARYYIEIAIRRWRHLGETLRECIARSYLGIILLKERSYEIAFHLFSEILMSAKQAQNQTLIAIFSTYLGTAAMHRGDFLLAHEQFQEALRVAVQIDRKTSMVGALEQVAQLALYCGQFTLATEFFAFVLAMRQQINIPVSPHNMPEVAEREANLRQCLGAAFDYYYRIGQEMTLTTAVQRAAAFQPASERATDAQG
ncbi:MAG: BTAD domain-containing putative transcriptional regulator [bacterium]|nr:BTAD domain-containing putative transcriptional regulator [bacterium]